MKCSEFETSLVDVLRAEHERCSAEVRNARAHAAECEHCGTRLEAELRLTADLRCLAASQAGEIASPAAEQNLLAAFRMKAQQQRTPVFTFWSNWWRWSAAAATFALLVVGVYAALHHARTPKQNAEIRPPAQQRFAPQQSMAGDTSTPPAQPMPVHQAKAAPKKGRAPERRVKAAEPEPEQVVTAFYALPYAAPLQPEESKRIVRVSVPRSALAVMGWPVNQERGMEPVDADLLVGEDNLARAIRLVDNRRAARPQLQSVSTRSRR